MTQTTGTVRATRNNLAGAWRSAAFAALLSAGMGLVLIAGNIDDGPIWRVSLVLAAVIAAVTAIVFGLVVHRALSARSALTCARVAAGLGALAVLSIAVFWLAVTPIFAIAALVLAREARERRPFRGEVLAAIAAIVGLLALLASLVLSLVS